MFIMFKIPLLALIASLGLTRAVTSRLVAWNTFINGYSIKSDLRSDSNNSLYSFTFDNNDYFLESASASYYYTADSGYTPTVSRSFAGSSYTCGNNPLLIAYVRESNTGINPLRYTSETTNYTYSFDSWDYNYTGSSYALVNYVGSLHTIYVHTNINRLNYNISVDWYNSTSHVHSYFTDIIVFDTGETFASIDIATGIPDDSAYFNINVVLNDFNNSDYYQAGYSTGYGVGYDVGNTDGYNTGYGVGYDAGYNTGATSASNFADLLLTVADTPIYYLKSLFNFELFGVNVAVAVLSLVTISVALYVVKKVV